MLRFGIYLVGLLLVLAAVWVLFTMTGVSDFVPLAVLAVVMLALLGIGVMRAAHTVDEHPPHPAAGREVVETRQRVGDTEIRRSKLQ